MGQSSGVTNYFQDFCYFDKKIRRLGDKIKSSSNGAWDIWYHFNNVTRATLFVL